MRESKVYMRKNGDLELVVEDVVALEPKGNGFRLVDVARRVYEVERTLS